MKDILSRYWFAFASIIIGGLFATLAEFQTDHAFIFFVIYITVITSVLGLWIESRETSVVTEAQMIAYFKRIRHKGQHNVVSDVKIAEISRITNELESKVYLLSPQEMEQLTSNNMVFEWYRSLSNENGYANGKCFTDKEIVKSYLTKFEDIRTHSRDFNIPTER